MINMDANGVNKILKNERKEFSFQITYKKGFLHVSSTTRSE